MIWRLDYTGRFPRRPHWEVDELERRCEEVMVPGLGPSRSCTLALAGSRWSWQTKSATESSPTGGDMRVNLTINGARHNADVEPRMLLVHYIRDVAGLTGTHVGCETTLCGACTVLMDGKAVKSCTVLAAQADDAQITTIEGMARDGKLHPLQDGFWEEHGLQCGYCTPGMIMAAADLLSRNSNPTDAEIRHALEGNLCRCTGYQNIIKAVQSAAEKMRASVRA